MSISSDQLLLKFVLEAMSDWADDFSPNTVWALRTQQWQMYKAPLRFQHLLQLAFCQTKRRCRPYVVVMLRGPLKSLSGPHWMDDTDRDGGRLEATETRGASTQCSLLLQL